MGLIVQENMLRFNNSAINHCIYARIINHFQACLNGAPYSGQFNTQCWLTERALSSRRRLDGSRHQRWILRGNHDGVWLRLLLLTRLLWLPEWAPVTGHLIGCRLVQVILARRGRGLQEQAGLAKGSHLGLCCRGRGLSEAEPVTRLVVLQGQTRKGCCSGFIWTRV